MRIPISIVVILFVVGVMAQTDEKDPLAHVEQLNPDDFRAIFQDFDVNGDKILAAQEILAAIRSAVELIFTRSGV